MLRVEPDPHAVVALAEQGDVSHARAAEQFVADANRGVIAHEHIVVAAVRREQIDGHEDVWGSLFDADALLLDHTGQQRHCQLDPVLRLNECQIGAGAHLERELQEVEAIIG